MAGNSSSFASNDSLLHVDIRLDIYCLLIIRRSSLIFSTFSVASILLLLPLCIFIIYLGLQRWCHQRSSSAAAAVTSHSDAFTYHMVAMEMIGAFGCMINCYSILRHNVNIFYMGYGLWFFNWCGEMSFHVLTCVERYLAVVHPVTYRGLRGERGIRIRNITTGCVWLLSFGITALTAVDDHFCMDFWLILFSFIAISFCSLSVLLVLIRPGPGEQFGDRERVDQSKRRAFYTILAILGVLVMRFGGNLVVVTVPVSDNNIGCMIMVCEFWFGLPSSLVLPLLFLNRAGVLTC